MAGSSEPFPRGYPSLRLTLGHPEAGFLLIMSSLGWVLTLDSGGRGQAHCHVEMSLPCSDLLTLHRPPVFCPSGQQGPAQVSLLAYQGPYQGSAHRSLLCPPSEEGWSAHHGLPGPPSEEGWSAHHGLPCPPSEEGWHLWLGITLPVSALEGSVNT